MYEDNEGNYYYTGMFAQKGRHIRFCTFKNRRILKNRFLPLSISPEKADADLEAYAKWKGWKEVETV